MRYLLENSRRRFAGRRRLSHGRCRTLQQGVLAAILRLRSLFEVAVGDTTPTENTPVRRLHVELLACSSDELATFRQSRTGLVSMPPVVVPRELQSSPMRFAGQKSAFSRSGAGASRRFELNDILPAPFSIRSTVIAGTSTPESSVGYHRRASENILPFDERRGSGSTAIVRMLGSTVPAILALAFQVRLTCAHIHNGPCGMPPMAQGLTLPVALSFWPGTPQVLF
jgi:hypothetical protein